MKLLVALAALVSMLGCTVSRIPQRAHPDDKRDVPMMLVVCVFARCDIHVPKQETPTPTPTHLGGKRADPLASRQDPGARAWGIGPYLP